MRRASCAIAVLGLFQFDCVAEERADKSRYGLFHPVPDSLLRDLTTDRPDKTESAYTLDAGHCQIEMDLLNYVRDRSGRETSKSLSVATTNFKIGVLNNLDLQIVVETYSVRKTTDRGTTSRVSGFGDLILRSKANLWGNDGGATALSVMPFIKLPAGESDLGNGATEGGVIFPFAMALPGEWDLGAQFEIDHLRDETGSDYHQEFVNTITVSHDIVGKLGGYVELFSNVSDDTEADWVATFDLGFTYAVSRDIQFDAGVNIGLTDAADDINPFLGLSLRY